MIRGAVSGRESSPPAPEDDLLEVVRAADHREDDVAVGEVGGRCRPPSHRAPRAPRPSSACGCTQRRRSPRRAGGAPGPRPCGPRRSTRTRPRQFAVRHPSPLTEFDCNRLQLYQRPHVGQGVSTAWAPGAAPLRRLHRATEVQVGHLRVVEHVVRRAGHEHAARLHDDPVRGQPQPEADVLLDEQDRLAGLAHQRDRLEDLLERPRVEAERRLVEQDRASGRASASGRPRPSAAARRTGCRPARRRARARPGTPPAPRPGAAQQRLVAAQDVGAHEHVLAHADVREEPAGLRHLGDARARGSPAGDRPAIERPSNSISPSRGCSRPLTERSTVDLPAPLGPTMQPTEPCSTSMSTPRSTSPPP